MITAPLGPDLASPAGSWAPPRDRWSVARKLAFAGIALVSVAVISLVAWGLFVSPIGFARYPLADQDRTFTIHRAGTYVVYFEYPGESRRQLPPAIDVSVVPLSGQKVDVRLIGRPGVAGTPAAYDLHGYEGRAIALITAHQAGTFVVSIGPKPAGEVDTSQQRIVTEGTIALGREWSRTWLAGWFGFGLIVIVPFVAGIGLMIAGWIRRGEVGDDR